MADTVRQVHLKVKSQLDRVGQVQLWFSTLCQSLDEEYAWIHYYRDRLALALTEGFTNAVRHAHAHLSPDTPITIDVALHHHHVEIRILDQGHPFNPELVPEPPPGALQEGGYGWFLLRRLADQVSYHRLRDGRNCLTIVKYASCLVQA
ncbi:MAG: anti-sigma regulatory factor [Cyanobacteria bacterium REEB459]|nr:anti-sigma regulatory factor [Cyanobacteria bacterium REEB459]